MRQPRHLLYRDAEGKLWTLPPIAGAGMPEEPIFDQSEYRARTSVPDPSGVDAAFDGGDTAENTDWTQTVDALIRIRFLIQQTEVLLINSNNSATEFLLQYNNGGGGWNTVGAVGADVEDVQFAAATGFANHDDTTTQRMGAGTQVDGDGLEAAGATDTITFTDEALTETELEVAIEIVSGQVTDLDTIQLRWVYSLEDEAPPATVLEAETLLTMTVDKPGADASDEEFAGTQGIAPYPVAYTRPMAVVAHDV